MWASTSERVHGGIDREELSRLGLEASDVVDFSVNVNPYGPCAPVLEALRAAPLDTYPDPHARAARAAWAARLDVPITAVSVGHGASDLFWAIARASVRPGARVVIAEPTFSEFRVAARACGAQIHAIEASAAAGFVHAAGALARAARGACALYLCAPNNPTGVYVPPTVVRELARALPDTCIVLDQSFLSLSEHAADERATFPSNVIRVRSLTKDVALPGLRIGLAVGAPSRMAAVEAVRPTWPTSAPALAAIAAAAHATDFVAESYARMRRDRAAVHGAFVERGFEPLVSSATYTLVHVEDARALRQELLRGGVNVRDCTSFGLPAYVRVAALPAPSVRELGRALAEVRRPAGACARAPAR